MVNAAYSTVMSSLWFHVGSHLAPLDPVDVVDPHREVQLGLFGLDAPQLLELDVPVVATASSANGKAEGPREGRGREQGQWHKEKEELYIPGQQSEAMRAIVLGNRPCSLHGLWSSMSLWSQPLRQRTERQRKQAQGPREGRGREQRQGQGQKVKDILRRLGP